MGTKWDLIIWVVLLALIAIFTLVRKAIEKATSGEQGKKIDLGKAVQNQLSKYMKAIEGTGAFPTAQRPQAPDRPAAPAPPASPAPPAPAQARPRQAPPPLPARLADQAGRKRGEPRRKPLVTARVPPLGRRAPPPVRRAPRGVRISKLDRREIRRAILTAEILGPPVSERSDYRLV